MRTSLAVVFGLGLLLAATPTRAHHSFAAEFDANVPVKVTGAITKVEWANPHVWFYLDVKDETGKVSNWAMEMGGVSGLLRRGWRRDSMKVGDVVTVDGFRARNGRDIGNATAVVLTGTGQRLFAGSRQAP